MKIEGTFPKYKVELDKPHPYQDYILYLDFSKMQGYKPEWRYDVHKIIARSLYVDVEEVEQAFGMIYENDIPPADITHLDIQGRKLLKMLRKTRNDHKWKPKGKTDNREEWRKKNALFRSGRFTIHELYEDWWINIIRT